ncbi:MAG: hypothetical protein ACRDTA_27720 [Pseudonocardiaceae bacterium]
MDSLRTKAIRALARHCEHRLFLSATPHNGYLESFTALLKLLDDQRFVRGVRPAENQLARVMVPRLKRILPPRWDGTPRFPQRNLDYLEVCYSEPERHAHRLLNRYAASRRSSADGKPAKAAADFVTTLLKRRMFSSPKAIAETLDVHLKTMTDRERVPAAPVGERVLRPLVERLDESIDDLADEAAYAQAEQDALTAIRSCAPALSAEERAMLTELGAWARGAQDRPDAKFTALRRWLDPIVSPAGQSTERVIIFTEYRDTQRWLHERLLTAGYPAPRWALLYGGQDEQAREHSATAGWTGTVSARPRYRYATSSPPAGIRCRSAHGAFWIREHILAMLGQEREHTPRRNQMTDQSLRVQKLPVDTLHTLHEPILPAQSNTPGQRADYSAPS